MKRFYILIILTLTIACSGIKSSNRNMIHVIPKNVLKKQKLTKKEAIASIEKKKTETTKAILKLNKNRIDVFNEYPASTSKKKYKLSVAYDSTSLYDFIVNVLQKTLHKNFIIKANIKLPVSIYLDGEFSEEELISFIRILLDAQRLTIVKVGNTYVIKQSKGTPKTPLASGDAWWLYRPRYIGTRNMLNVVRNLLTTSGGVYNLGNMVLIADERNNLAAIRRLVRLIDVDDLSSFNIRVFKLVNSSPTDIYKEIQNILKSTGVEKSSYSVIPIDRLNLLVVLTTSESLMNKLDRLIKLLDSEENRENKKIYIYRVQYVDVEKLSKTLESFLSGKKVISSNRNKKAKKTTPTIVTSNVIIVPDKTTNTLIIEASPEDYQKIRKLIEELDVMPRQVLIEVLIAEVTLNKQLENGVEWWLKSHGKYAATASINYGLTGSKENLFGFTYYGVNPDNFWHFLYALSTKSKITVLSSPHILVRDNEGASIDVGQEVPILTMETVGTTQISGTSAIDRRVEYRDVGVILRVKPHISEEGFVTLEVEQETSQAEKNTVSGIDSPIILKRKIKTTLMVQDGHSIILGGIINRRTNAVKKSIPILGDLPFFGKLFSYESKEKENTELIIMITPHVIKSVEEADVISSIFEKRLQGLVGRQKK